MLARFQPLFGKNKVKLKNVFKHVDRIKVELRALRREVLQYRASKDTAQAETIIDRVERVLVMLAGQEPGEVQLADIKVDE